MFFLLTKFYITLFFLTAEMSFGAACIFLRGGKNIVSTAATVFMQSSQPSASAPNLSFCAQSKHLFFLCAAKTVGR